MKTTKFFFMAALALTFTACSNDDFAEQPAEQPSDKMITITAQLAPKGNDGMRAVTEDGDNIAVTWAEGEHLAILYNKDGNQMADAEITAVDGSGNATITFSVVDGTPDDTDCTIIYPYSAAKEDKTGLKDNTTLLANQSGRLSAKLDVRVGDGYIQTSTPGLNVKTQPEAQFAIWKLTLSPHSAEALYITVDGKLIAGANYGTAIAEFTVAVPAVSSKTVSVVAVNNTDCYYYSKSGVTLAAGNYYKSPVTINDVGTSSTAPVYKVTDSDYTSIDDGKTVVFSGFTNNNGIYCDGDVTIILAGNNTVNGGTGLGCPAIGAGSSGKTLTITGTGSLTATGGPDCAAIGSGSGSTCGNIIICGGMIEATGGGNPMYPADFGAGIGAGHYGNCGDITITGRMVRAISRNLSPIGKGSGSSCGKITFGSEQVYDGSNWLKTMEIGTYGGLMLVIGNSNVDGDTWTLLPTAP